MGILSYKEYLLLKFAGEIIDVSTLKYFSGNYLGDLFFSWAGCFSLFIFIIFLGEIHRLNDKLNNEH